LTATLWWPPACAGVRFSITTKQRRPVRAAIEAIDPHDWVPIAYPLAIYDQATGQWISDAEIAETTYTAYQSRRKSEQITIRLIVRRVKDKNIMADQGELFSALAHMPSVIWSRSL
jgi:hypothetical protein